MPGTNGTHELELDGLAQYLDPSRHGTIAAKPALINLSESPRTRGRCIWLTISDDEGLYYEKR